jgi:hypothetical protein
MNQKQKIYNFQGKETKGEEIDFEIEKEGWNIYILNDGTKLKMKSVVANIIRLEEYKPDTGEPVYMINASPVIAADVPESLRKKP